MKKPNSNREPKTKPRPKSYWCCFFKNRPQTLLLNDGFQTIGVGAVLYTNKKDAESDCSDDIRLVNIVEVT